jgi:hypothetical protein
MLYSDRPGRFEGVRGIREVEGIRTYRGVKPDHEILSPHLEMVHYVLASGANPERVEGLLDDALREAVVMVDAQEIPVPLSAYTGARV